MGDIAEALISMFAIDVEYLDDGTVYVSHRQLPVHGNGESLDDAIADFGATFDALWRRLKEAGPARMTPHAQRVWDRLQHYVEGVTER